MDKYPWMQFFSGDWLKDPSVSKCSPVTRGIWIDFLCVMHESDRSGVITGTREQLARLGRCSAVELAQAVEELKCTSAADVTERDGVVTVINRRMNREFKQRKNNTLRQTRFRQNNSGNADVTGHISEVRSQKSEREGDGAREVPDFEQAFVQTSSAGIPKEFCRYVHDDWTSRGGKDGAGNIVEWLRYVVKRWAREGTEWRNGTHKGNKSQKKSGGNL